MANRIPVKSPEGQYDIVIEPGLFRTLNLTELRLDGYDGRVAIITNTTLAAVYRDFFATTFPDALVLTMVDGEQHKTLATVASLYAGLIEAGLDRSSTVIGFGGGVVGDVAGFVAATYLRGVRFVQVPTSLLAMVDSSVGGKVGVDLPQGKNLIGAFKQPTDVLIDTELLDTLPVRELRCGLAELIKHGLLADQVLLDMIGGDTPDEVLVARAVQVKVDVVQADPFEQGIRAHLNLGHTFGHAIEHASGYAFAHGEAVAIGLAAAALLSKRLGLCAPSLIETVYRLLETVGLPTRMGDLDVETVYNLMGTDKKKQRGQLRFVLLRDIGQPLITADVSKEDVIAILKEII